MGLIEVSSTRGDYVVINLHQVAWATVEEGEEGVASKITLHMMDGVAFQLRDAEAAHALNELRRTLGNPPGAPD